MFQLLDHALTNPHGHQAMTNELHLSLTAKLSDPDQAREWADAGREALFAPFRAVVQTWRESDAFERWQRLAKQLQQAEASAIELDDDVTQLGRLIRQAFLDGHDPAGEEKQLATVEDKRRRATARVSLLGPLVDEARRDAEVSLKMDLAAERVRQRGAAQKELAVAVATVEGALAAYQDLHHAANMVASLTRADEIEATEAEVWPDELALHHDAISEPPAHERYVHTDSGGHANYPTGGNEIPKKAIDFVA